MQRDSKLLQKLRLLKLSLDKVLLNVFISALGLSYAGNERFLLLIVQQFQMYQKMLAEDCWPNWNQTGADFQNLWEENKSLCSKWSEHFKYSSHMSFGMM